MRTRRAGWPRRPRIPGCARAAPPARYGSSRRASAAPRHLWAPSAEGDLQRDVRGRRSKRSARGVGNCRSSRHAAAVRVRTKSALRHGDVVQGDVTHQRAALVLRRRPIAAGIPRRRWGCGPGCRPVATALIGMAGEEDDGVAEEPVTASLPAADRSTAEPDQPRRRVRRWDSPLLVGELGVGEQAGHVVARPPRASRSRAGRNTGTGARSASRALGGNLRASASRVSDSSVHSRIISRSASGTPIIALITADRQARGEVGDEVAASASAHAVEEPRRAVRRMNGLERADARRRERLSADEPPQARLPRRIHEDDDRKALDEASSSSTVPSRSCRRVAARATRPATLSQRDRRPEAELVVAAHRRVIASSNRQAPMGGSARSRRRTD
mgnify:CR=1 FL=1